MSRTFEVCARGALAGLLIASLSAPGHARPDARTLTCSQVQALLEREGAATISTGARTFGRYVSNSASCPGTEVARRATIATQDTGQCDILACERRVPRVNSDN